MPADAPLLCSPSQEELFLKGNPGSFEKEKICIILVRWIKTHGWVIFALSLAFFSSGV